MDFKTTLVLFIAFGMSLARRRRVVQEKKPTTIVVIQNLITPEPDFIDTRIMECLKPCQTIPMAAPIPVNSPIPVVTPIPYREELILPPQIAELPYGLGYFPSALPIVSRCYQPEIICQEAVMPVTNLCSCMSLATPMFDDYECLARPIIL